MRQVIDNQPLQTPLEDLKQDALRHYDEITTKAYSWYAIIPVAIRFYFDQRIFERDHKVDKLTIGIKFSLHAFWIGFHHAKYHKRTCINIIPFVTIYIVRKGGNLPFKYLNNEKSL